MLQRLAKLAQVSAHLRKVAFRKEAIIAGLAKGVGSWAMKNPGSALVTGLGAGFGVAGARGKFKQYKAGFDPEVQKAMMGPAPMPPE